MKIRALAFVDKTDSPRLRMANKTGFNLDLDKFDHDDKVWVVVETFRNKRTLGQNELMHVIFQYIADETGQDMAVIKAVLKKKFLTVPILDHHGEQVVDMDTGELLTKVLSTSGLDTKEGSEFIDNIMMWAREYLGIILPDKETLAKIKIR